MATAAGGPNDTWLIAEAIEREGLRIFCASNFPQELAYDAGLRKQTSRSTGLSKFQIDRIRFGHEKRLARTYTVAL